MSKKPDTLRVRDVFDVAPGAHEPLADLAAAAGDHIEERLNAHSRPGRPWAAYLFLLLAIVSGVTGTSALSASAGFTLATPIAITTMAYLVCFLAFTRALRAIPVSIAYAIWSGAGIALITLIGWRVFAQQLNFGELAGIALILAGVIVIQLFSSTRAH